MILIRIETIKDQLSGLYYVEVYQPPDADQPLVTTEPRYKTMAVAENDIIAIIAASTNNPRN